MCGVRAGYEVRCVRACAAVRAYVLSCVLVCLLEVSCTITLVTPTLLTKRREKICVQKPLRTRAAIRTSSLPRTREAVRSYHSAYRALVDRLVQGGGRQRLVLPLPQQLLLACRERRDPSMLV